MAKCENPLIKLVGIPAHIAILAGMALLSDTHDARMMRWRFSQMIERGMAKGEQLAVLKMEVVVHETAMETNFTAALDIFRRVGLSEEHIMEYVTSFQLEGFYKELRQSA